MSAVKRCFHHFEDAVPPKSVSRSLDLRLTKATAYCWLRRDLWQAGDAGDADVDDLDRARLEDIAIFGAVQISEPSENLFERRLVQSPVGKRDAQLVTLTDIAQNRPRARKRRPP